MCSGRIAGEIAGRICGKQTMMIGRNDFDDVSSADDSTTGAVHQILPSVLGQESQW